MTAPPAKLRLVFCGTPQFAVPTLEALIAAGHEISLVVTQPDRPVGRKQIFTAPPVKQVALAHGLEITQPDKIKNNLEFRAHLEAIAPDAIVVVAYGRIIPRWMLDLPRLGSINLHGSLLPKYRGAAPIQWAVAMGEVVSGNTTMLLEEGLDTGPILLQQQIVSSLSRLQSISSRSCRFGRTPYSRNPRRTGRRQYQAGAARPLQGNSGSHPGPRRRQDGFRGAYGNRAMESLARLPALAGSLHDPCWEEAHRPRKLRPVLPVSPIAEPGEIRR